MKILTLLFMSIAFASTVEALPFIMGTVNLGSPVANVRIPNLNNALFIGAPSATVTSPATGSFTGSFGMPVTVLNIPNNFPIAGFMIFDGFTIDVASFLSPNVWTVTSLGGGVDFLSAAFSGTAKKAGFNNTPVIGAISSQFSNGYNPQAIVAWSANISISQIPEPMTFGLLGAGLIGIAALRRRKKNSSS